MLSDFIEFLNEFWEYVYVQQKVSLYVKWFYWILNEFFIDNNELDLMKK